MKRFIKIFVASILLISLFVNSAFAVCDWGVDERGNKFGYKRFCVVIKDEYSSEPETVIKHFESVYDVVKVEVISDLEDVDHPLMLLVHLPVLSEEYFYSIYDAVAEDPYVEFVFKDYYISPVDSYLGDVNQDGEIQTDDARTILMYAAGQLVPPNLTQKMLADADRDGVITTQDARYVLSVACGIM